MVVGLGVFGIVTSFVVENPIIGDPLFILCALGIGFIFKWIPFRKRNLNK